MNAADKHGTKERSKALILLIITSVLWSLGGILIKLVSWNPVAIAGMRSAIAALLMLAVIKKPKLKFSLNLIFGAIAYSGTVLLFVIANKMTTAANAILLQYTAPIFVALFGAWFLKEKTMWIDWVTIVFVFGGMLLFFMDKVSSGGVWGNIIAIVSGIFFAGTAMFMRRQKDESPLESIFLGNILTALISLPFMFQSMPDAKSWAGLLALGVVQLGLSYILYSIAIKNVTALEAVLIPVIEPVLNPVWVYLVIGERPGQWSLIGGGVVLLFVTARCVAGTLRQVKALQQV